DVQALASLPLTASGKLDRRRLPAPPARDAAAGETRARPSGPPEETLAALFGEGLGREVDDADADFFALGGHSLPAPQPVSRLRARYQVEVSTQELLAAPSVAALGARLRSDPPRAARIEKHAAVLHRVAALSDEEVERLLAAADGSSRPPPAPAGPAAAAA